jgi:hypothetical protein
MRRQALLTALAASFLLSPALASAQLATEKKWKRGPNTRQLAFLYLTPRISLQRFGYDNNVYIQDKDPVRDTNLAVTGTLEAFVPVGRRLRLIGTGSASPTFFREQRDEGSFDWGVGGSAQLDLGPMTFFGGVGHSRAKQRSSPDIDQRVWHTEDFVSAGASIRPTKRLALSGAVEWRTFVYDADSLASLPIKASMDRDTRRTTGEVSFIATRRTTLLARAEVIDDEFAASPVDPDGDTVRSYRYLGGLAFTAGVLDGQVLGGVRSFPSGQSSSAPPYEGPVLQITLGTPFVFGSRLSLVANREVQYAVTRANAEGPATRSTYVWGHYGASTSFEIPLGLVMRPSVYYDRSSYLQPYTQDGVSKDRNDGTWLVSLGLLRHFGERILVGVIVERALRSSTLDGFGYSATRWGVTAEIWP